MINKTDSCNIQNTKRDNLVPILVNFFRSYGHFFADLNPLSPNENQPIDYQKHSNLPYVIPARDAGFYSGPQCQATWVTEDFSINLNGLFNKTETTVGEFISILKNVYCKNIGFEFMHISFYEERVWLQERVENQNHKLNSQSKKEILRHLIESEVFEQFLHMKFPGYKRFSIEGGESTVVAIERIISDSISFGIKEIVFGMAHRGRLNVLTKVMGKEYSAILSEFQGNLAYPDSVNVSGDVKYHLGYSSDRILDNNKKIHLSLCFNPSHLEAVNPVLAGRVRAKQDSKEDNSAIGISIHGDAAFIGQGVVDETLTLSNIEGYKVGGIVHIIINNQVGFTANPCCTRSSFYCTDVAKSIEAPIFHVNGDNPEAVSFAASLGMEYRQKFKKDVVIDIICYRKYGHNEGDEPNFTQPIMYKLISKHKTPGKLYEEKLIEEKVVDSNEVSKLRNEFRTKLDKSLAESVNFTPKKADWFSGVWSKLRRARLNDLSEYSTDSKVLKDELKKLGMQINSNIPSSFRDIDFLSQVILPAIKRLRIDRPIILHDNARPHKHSKVQDFFVRHQWEELKHPPYSPDLNPCDYDGIYRIKRPNKDKRFNTPDELEVAYKEVIDDINLNGSATGISHLPLR